MPLPHTSPHTAAAVIEGLEFLTGAAISTDGTRAVWTIGRIVGDTEVFDLWTAEIDAPTDAARPGRRVWTGEAVFGLAWSPMGESVAFAALAGGAVQVHLLEIGSGSVRVVSDLPSGVSGAPVWSPDGRGIAIVIRPAQRDLSVPFRVTRTIGWKDGIGFMDNAAGDIAVLDPATGAVARLTDDDWSSRNPVWAADGRSIGYVAGSAPEDWMPRSEIRSVDLSGTVRVLATHPDIFGFTLIGDKPVFTSAGSPLTGRGAAGAVWAIEDDGSRVNRSAGFDIAVGGDVIGDMPVPFSNPDPRILEHDGAAIVRVQVGERLEIHRVAVDGDSAAECVVATEGCAYPLGVGANRILFAAGTRTTTPDLWVRDLGSGADVRLTWTAEDNRARLRATQVTTFSVPAGEFQVPAVFLRPEGAELPLPTILLIHGGPEATFGEAFFADAQLLCEAGYGVLMANPRGSRGYGEDFQNAIAGRWGGPDFDDLMSVVDRAMELGLADPEQLAVAGLSYGGYMTTWLVTHTDRFKAAIAENPVTNILSFAGTSDVGLAFGPAIMAAPITEPEQYLRSSPILSAGTCRTPTLLIVGDQDRRCPPEQGMQLYSRLRAAGCIAELLVLPGESHEGSISGLPISRRAQNVALVEWVQRFLPLAPPIGE